ncbi:MAG: hypothetical protein G01um101416_1176 [Microgenomates group bacterium Gr01-1014_16]|nr:MAG: hypothetical protein G01um101416_1176 [Microgenomates group bacterium Gr01-1014_16]
MAIPRENGSITNVWGDLGVTSIEGTWWWVKDRHYYGPVWSLWTYAAIFLGKTRLG